MYSSKLCISVCGPCVLTMSRKVGPHRDKLLCEFRVFFRFKGLDGIPLLIHDKIIIPMTHSKVLCNIKTNSW